MFKNKVTSYLAWLLVLVILLGVFSLYANPHFVRDISDFLYSCF